MMNFRALILFAVAMTSLQHATATCQETTLTRDGKDVTDAFTPVGKSLYYNDFAGLTLEVPPDAVVMADNKVQELAEASRELVKERSSRFRKAIEKGYKSKTLFRLNLKRPEAKTVGILPGIAAWQEELKENHEVTPERFLANLRKAMQQSSKIKYHKDLFSKKTEEHTFNFQIGQVNVKKADQTITGIQEQHVIILDDRAIGFALTYNTASEGKTLREILWSLKIDKEGSE